MKLLLKISMALIALVFVTIILLLIMIDPNDYKTEIQDQVKQNINRTLHINGDIGWTFYPQIGFSTGEIELDNLAQFSRPHLLKIKNASLGIDLLPLLKGEIKVGELTLDGLEFTLLTNKKGLSNLDNMSAKEKAPASTTTSSSAPSVSEKSSSPAYFDSQKAQLAGIKINNAIIEIEDLQAGTHTKASIDHIHIGQFALGKATTLSVLTDVLVADMKGKIDLTSSLMVSNDINTIQLNDFLLKANFNGNTLPNGKIDSQLSANINYQLDSGKASIESLALVVDNIKLNGQASVQSGAITKVRYALIGNVWDLNPYLSKEAPAAKETTTKTASSAAQTPAAAETVVAEQEPDLSFLNSLDINGTLKIAGLLVDKITIGEINNTLIINKGKAELKPLTAQLYQGLLTVNGWVADDKGRNRYQLSTALKEVQIRPLLTDAAGIDLLSGTTAFNFSASGSGLTSSKIKSGISGQGDFKLLDGEIYGVNVPHEIRTLKAKITAKPLPTADNIKKTDFASLSGNFSIDKGLVDNQKFLMLSPVMRLDGLGLIDILQENLDYKLSISPLSRSKETTDYTDLSGLTIPMLITGSFYAPKFALDTDSALAEQLKAKAKLLEKEVKAKLQAEQAHLQEKAEQLLKENGDKLDAQTQEKIKKEGKRLEDKLKKFF